MAAAAEVSESTSEVRDTKRPVDCWQPVFLSKFSRDYEERLFSLKENGTRHGRSTYILPNRSFAFVMPRS